MFTAFLPGFLLCLGLIVAIGAQNAFVLRQGLRNRHVLAVCIVCALSDAVLILVGVLAFDRVAAELPLVEPAMRYVGAVFLLWYGLRSARSALRGTDGLAPADAANEGLKATLLTCLALTWLNPHVYLDTVVLIGSLASQFGEAKGGFALGAMTASLVFFFSLGFGARLLRPLFARPAAWRVLDAGVALVMWGIAGQLLLGAPGGIGGTALAGG